MRIPVRKDKTLLLANTAHKEANRNIQRMKFVYPSNPRGHNPSQGSHPPRGQISYYSLNTRPDPVRAVRACFCLSAYPGSCKKGMKSACLIIINRAVTQNLIGKSKSTWIRSDVIPKAETIQSTNIIKYSKHIIVKIYSRKPFTSRNSASNFFKKHIAASLNFLRYTKFISSLGPHRNQHGYLALIILIQIPMRGDKIFFFQENSHQYITCRTQCK